MLLGSTNEPLLRPASPRLAAGTVSTTYSQPGPVGRVVPSPTSKGAGTPRLLVPLVEEAGAGAGTELVSALEVAGADGLVASLRFFAVSDAVPPDAVAVVADVAAWEEEEGLLRLSEPLLDLLGVSSSSSSSDWPADSRAAFVERSFAGRLLLDEAAGLCSFSGDEEPGLPKESRRPPSRRAPGAGRARFLLTSSPALPLLPSSSAAAVAAGKGEASSSPGGASSMRESLLPALPPLLAGLRIFFAITAELELGASLSEADEFSFEDPIPEAPVSRLVKRRGLMSSISARLSASERPREAT